MKAAKYTAEGLTMSDISVIVRVKDEERFIGHCLQSILDNINTPQIIIVDNESKDESIKIASLFKHDTSLPINNKKFANIEILNISNYTPGKAIALGLTQCKSKYTMVISAHCVINKFNENLVKETLEESAALFGRQIPHYCGKRLNSNYIWSHFGDNRVINMYSELEKRYFFHNAFAIYRTNIFQDVPLNYDLVGKEDRYWAADLVEKGYTYVYEPNICVSHHFTSGGNTWKGIG